MHFSYSTLFDVPNYQNMPKKIDMKCDFTSKSTSYSLKKDLPLSCPDSILIKSEKDADSEHLLNGPLTKYISNSLSSS